MARRKVEHELTWGTDKDKPWTSGFKNSAQLVTKASGWKVPYTGAHATVTFHGPAVTTWKFTSAAGSLYVIKTFTPVEALQQRIEDVVFVDKDMPRLLADYILWNAQSGLQQDFDVWSTKAFKRKPLVVRGDGPMMLNRRWYNQFYTEHSRTEPDQSALAW